MCRKTSARSTKAARSSQSVEDERVDPGPGDPVGPGHLADRALLDSDSSDDQPGFRHPRKIDSGCPRCPETPVLDVQKLGTAIPTSMAWRLATLTDDPPARLG
jgi:hypothetical protein